MKWCNRFIHMQAYAEVMVAHDCFDGKALAAVSAVTETAYTVIEGCQRDDSADGDASGTTAGSTAKLVRPHRCSLTQT